MSHTQYRHLKLMLLCIILVACGAPAAQTNPTPHQTLTNTPLNSQNTAVEVPSDKLRWSLEGVDNLVSLDPSEPVNISSNTVIGLVFNGLVRLDEYLEVQPDGAESWEVSKDGKTYTFQLRQNLQFADGTPVTAQDFVYSINRALAPATASYGAPFQLGQIVGALDVVEGRTSEVAGVQALDEHTLQIELLKPQAHFLSQLAYSYTFVVPQHLVESSDTWEQQAFGTGPFRVKTWTPNEGIVLEANPRYWRGELTIKELHFLFYPDSEAALQAYLTGKVDIMGGPQTPIPTHRLNEVQHLPDFRTSASLVTRYIGFNNQQEPFDDVLVRQALALATNRTELVADVLAGAAEPATRILPTGLLGTELPIRPLEYDPMQAQALITSVYSDSTRIPTIELAYAKEGDNAQVAQYLAQNWSEALNLPIEAREYELEMFIQLLDTTYFTPSEGLDMYLSVWGADYPDPQNFISQQLHSDSPNNNGHFTDPEFDRLVEQADRLGKAEELDKRLQLYNFAEQIALDKVGWLPLYYPTFTTLLRPDIEGMLITPIGIVIPNWIAVRRS